MHNLFKLFQLLLMAIVLVSCELQSVESDNSVEKDLAEISDDVYQQLGATKLVNPYSVSNMRVAWNNLKTQLEDEGLTGLERIVVRPTHYYVKFKPRDEYQMDLLNADSTLYLYNYPLDMAIDEGSYDYKSPSIPDDQPAYQYASVPVDYSFPEVRFDILEELFIPDSTTFDAQLLYILPCLPEMMEDEALRLSDNLEQLAPVQDCGSGGGGGGGSTGCSYCPQGTLRVWDDQANAFVPLVGVKVRARRWFTTKTGITDATGKYIIHHNFRRPKNYSIRWERYDFSIRTGTFGQATYNGPKTSGWWSKNFGYSGSSHVADKHQCLDFSSGT